MVQTYTLLPGWVPVSRLPTCARGRPALQQEGDRDREIGCMAERGGREVYVWACARSCAPSSPRAKFPSRGRASAHAEEGRTDGRLNRKKIFPSFLPFLFFLSIGLAVARSVASAADGAAANASGSVM